MQHVCMCMYILTLKQVQNCCSSCKGHYGYFSTIFLLQQMVLKNLIIGVFSTWSVDICKCFYKFISAVIFAKKVLAKGPFIAEKKN